MYLHLISKSLIPLCILWLSSASAQNTISSEPIELLASRENNSSQPGPVVYKYTGNVKLRHQGTLLFCDQAIRYGATNRIEAIGHVLLVQGDTITIKGDTLLYDGNTRRASLYGRVTFQDRRLILITTQLDYDINAFVAHYTNRGRLVNGQAVLTSREGYYDTRTRQLELQYDVRLTSPDNTLTSDVLMYNTVSRLATLMGATRITGKDGVNIARQGQYDTQTSQIQQSAAMVSFNYVSQKDVSAVADLSGMDADKGSIMLPTKADKLHIDSQKNRLVLVQDEDCAYVANKSAAKLVLRSQIKKKRSLAIVVANQESTSYTGADTILTTSPQNTAAIYTAAVAVRPASNPSPSIKSVDVPILTVSIVPKKESAGRWRIAPANKPNSAALAKTVPLDEESDLELALKRKKRFN